MKKEIKFNLDALRNKTALELGPGMVSALFEALEKVNALKEKTKGKIKEIIQEDVENFDFAFSAEITFKIVYDGEIKIEIIEKPTQAVPQVPQRAQTTTVSAGRGQKVPRTFIVIFPDGRQETFQIANKAAREIARYLNDNVPGSFDISAKLLGHANQAEVLKSMRQTLENLGFQIEILEG